jgi:uncharacterized membrane protein/phage FluMu protein Com
VTIEFHCPHCKKLLKTADDKAGVRAKCPGCGEVVTVPTQQAEAAGFDASFDESFGGMARSSPPPIPVTAPPAPPPQAAPESELMRPCPMCGESIRAAATRCRYCGEVLVRDGGAEEGVPTRIDAGEVISRSWAIFQKEMGMCIAVVLVAGLLYIVPMVPLQITVALLESGAIGKELMPLAVVVLIVFGLLALAFIYFLTIGQTLFMLKVARGQPVQFSDLFAGGRYFWRAIGAVILVTLMTTAGLFLCLVGSFVIVLLFGPYLFVLIDRDVGAVESLSGAYRITSNNLLQLFVIWLAVFGMSLLGSLTCGLATIVIAPFIMLIQAVAYLEMSGLPTAPVRR